MRQFCTEGPVDPARNYFVPRTTLVAKGMEKVDQGRYFTIFAPRQSGKTTYFQFLIEAIKVNKPDWLPLWITFESLGEVEEQDFLTLIYPQMEDALNIRIDREDSIPKMELCFRKIVRDQNQDLVLIVDEVEGLKNEKLLSQWLHLIRSIYHRKDKVGLHSVIFTGVSNITGILQDTASPFNIADQIDLPYFTRDEVFDLLSQHEQETDQSFDEVVKEGIYANTLGQPGLVNALARDLVEKKCPEGQPVTMEAFYQTLEDFSSYYIDKNISNILSKASLYPMLMKEILFGQSVPFKISQKDIGTLFAHGVIDRDSSGNCHIPVPLYHKALYHHFKPSMNGEKQHFITPFDDPGRFLTGKSLDMLQILHNYVDYLSRRGNLVFKGSGEGQFHYNLDAYLQSMGQYMDAKVYPEVVEGGGRVDLLVIQGKRLWIIEVKEYTNAFEYRKAFEQIQRYLKNARMDTGYLLFFSRHHEHDSYEAKEINGKTIHTWIICVQRELPSSRSGTV